jgi:pimeloyl-ACP methyl ester carboxylesterase
MNRRAFASIVAAGAVSALFQGAAAAPAPKARNVVLVHGLFADGSSWSEVIARLQAAGLNVTSVQNPLTTLPEAVASAERVLARQDGPTVLAGHSFSGIIVTEAGMHPNVSALVYVAARAPDAGEDYAALAKTFPTPPASAGVVFDGNEGRLTEAAFLRDFAGDLPEAKAKVLYAVQEPFQKALLEGKTTCGLAVEAEFLCRFHGRPNDQSRSRTLHGQAHGRQDHRGEGQPPLADLPSRRDHRVDPRSRRTVRLAGWAAVTVHGLFADVLRRQSERLVPNLRTPARAHVRWPVYIPRKSSRALSRNETRRLRVRRRTCRDRCWHRPI